MTSGRAGRHPAPPRRRVVYLDTGAEPDLVVPYDWLPPVAGEPVSRARGHGVLTAAAVVVLLGLCLVLVAVLIGFRC